MGNLTEVKEEISDFRNRLYIYLGLFGLGSILINAAIILFGLRPLDHNARTLADIREGAAIVLIQTCRLRSHLWRRE